MIPSFLNADELAELWLRKPAATESTLRVLFLDLDGVIFHEDKDVRTLLPDALRRLVRLCYEGHLTIVLISNARLELSTVQDFNPLLGDELCYMLHERAPRVSPLAPRTVAIAGWIDWALKHREGYDKVRIAGIVDDTAAHYRDALSYITSSLVLCTYDEGFGPKQDAIIRASLKLPMTDEWASHPKSGLTDAPEAEL
jgi:hypothetical protein